MSFLGSTMSALKAILRGTSRPTSYQTLPTSDSREEESADIRREGDHDQAVYIRREGDHDQAVYISFWLFGAGCLLGWNGQSFIPLEKGRE